MNLDDELLRRALLAPATDWRTQPQLRDAAVLAPLFRRDGQDWLLYTLRRDDLESHAGEMSFPGGAREGDEDALTCALRESHEEVGLAPESVDVLGRLGECTSIAGYRVHVFVGRIPPPDGLVPDPREVARLLPIPLDQLVQRDRWEWRTVEHPRLIRQIPFFEYDGEMLWGLTGLLTLDLLDRGVEPGAFLSAERREFLTSWEEKRGPRDCVE